MSELRIRPSLPGELAFVRETTLKVLWPRRAWSWRRWERAHGPEVDAAIANGRLVVAGDDDVAAGFGLATDGGVLVMLYVKAACRGLGLGAAMVTALDLGAPVRVADATESWRAWCRRHRIAWQEFAPAVGGKSEAAA